MAAAKKTKTQNGNTPHHEPEAITVTNPVTGETLGTVPVTSPAEIEAAVKRARTAQRLWRAMSTAERCKLLRKFQDMLWEQQREVMDTIRRETGKNAPGAFIEIAVMDSHLNWIIAHAPQVLAPQRRAPAFPIIQRSKVYFKPYGVVGFITPWNYPMLLVFVDVIPALAAGNAVIIKPSELTPYSSLLIMKMLHQAGIPQDIVQVLTGDGSTGAALIDQVDYISFTGSSGVGQKVAVHAAERMISYCLELGGKDLLLALRDANIELAASGALMGAFENAGQMCISIKRAYVDALVYDSFVEKVKFYAQQMNIGAGDGMDVHIGSMTSEAEIDRVERHVADALDKGAALIYGGQRRPDLGPLFYEPAILINVDHTMDIMTEETFGPVLPIMRVQNEAEAVRMANDSEYGLSSVIYTNDLALGEHLALQLETGDVGVNRPGAVAAAPNLPWGGRKRSGVGRRGGIEGLTRFVTPQSITVDTMLGSKPSVSLVDPTIIALVKALHVLRRYIPFI